MKSLFASLLLIVVAGIVVAQQIPAPLTTATTHATAYLGYGCNMTTTNSCTVGSSTATGIGNLLGATFTTGSSTRGYTVSACGLYVGAVGGGGLVCAIYDGNSTGSNPICTTTNYSNLTSTSFWMENTQFSNCHLAASTTYTFVFAFSVSSTDYNYNSTGTRRYVAASFNTFPTNVSWSTSTASYSQYIRMTAN